MKTLKNIAVVMAVGAGLLAGQPVRAGITALTGISGVYSSGTVSPSQVIPDNNPGGVSYGFSIADTGLQVSQVTVLINMSGGYNGDMYAYLAHGSTLVELLNSTVYSTGGAGGNTINVTMSSAGSAIPVGGLSAAQLSAGSTYGAPGDLGNFNYADPNGLWTLFFSDTSPGDTMTLNTFDLSITAVPEPVNTALALFGGLFAVLLSVRTTCRKTASV